RPPHSRAGTSGTSSKTEFSNVTISLRSIRDRDHEAGYTDNNAAQPSVPISGKTLSGPITRPHDGDVAYGVKSSPAEDIVYTAEERSINVELRGPTRSPHQPAPTATLAH